MLSTAFYLMVELWVLLWTIGLPLPFLVLIIKEITPQLHFKFWDSKFSQTVITIPGSAMVSAARALKLLNSNKT
jgi:hypothetical protein